jgi:hypothetical protein
MRKDSSQGNGVVDVYARMFILYIATKMVSIITGGDTKYISLNKWYQYEAHRIIENADRADQLFRGRKYISAEDIVDHIVYGKYGAYILVRSMRSLKKLLEKIENKIVHGLWKNTAGIIISKLTSHAIDTYIDDLTPISLEKLSNSIQEDLYLAYFHKTYPDIITPEPKMPAFPPLPTVHISINDPVKIKQLVEDILPYINMLEKYHSALYDLIASVVDGLQIIIHNDDE